MSDERLRVNGGSLRGFPSVVGYFVGAGGPGGEGELDEERDRDLGLLHEHAAGLEERGAGAGGLVRKPYSPRSASAASRRPTTRNEALATTRRSISLAVCWAPMRMTPRLRPRSAMSRTTSLIGLRPSRGAYLLSSSRTRKTRGSRRALPVLVLQEPLEDDADDEALGAVVEVVDVDDVELAAAASRCGAFSSSSRVRVRG